MKAIKKSSSQTERPTPFYIVELFIVLKLLLTVLNVLEILNFMRMFIGCLTGLSDFMIAIEVLLTSSKLVLFTTFNLILIVLSVLEMPIFFENIFQLFWQGWVMFPREGMLNAVKYYCKVKIHKLFFIIKEVSPV